MSERKRADHPTLRVTCLAHTERSTRMSNTVAQVRTRMPRIAEVAVERARLTVVPVGVPAPRGCRSSRWSR